MQVPAVLHVIADGQDAGKQVLEVGGDGDFLHRELDLAVLHPVAAGAAGVVAGDQVDALPHQLGDQQAAAHASQQGLLVLVAVADEEVVHAAGVGRAGHAQLETRVPFSTKGLA